MVIKAIQWLASRARKRPVTTVILHASAGSSLSGAISTLKLKGLSYHYLITKDGTITKCCPTSRVAFHAGKSLGPDGPNVNNYSIGISFVNKNDGLDPIPIEQEKAAQELVSLLVEEITTIKYVTTHYAISPGRKTDPRPMNYPRLRQFARVVGLSSWI